MDMETSTLYIVMELMECDLERVLASGQDLTHDHVQVLLKQLLLGIQAMHRHGIMRAYTTMRAFCISCKSYLCSVSAMYARSHW